MLPPETLERYRVSSRTERPPPTRIRPSASRPAAPKTAARLPPPESAMPTSRSPSGAGVMQVVCGPARGSKIGVADAQPVRRSRHARALDHEATHMDKLPLSSDRPSVTASLTTWFLTVVDTGRATPHRASRRPGHVLAPRPWPRDSAHWMPDPAHSRRRCEESWDWRFTARGRASCRDATATGCGGVAARCGGRAVATRGPNRAASRPPDHADTLGCS